MKYNKLKIISAKDLGHLAMPEFCPHCFWLERHIDKPPGIFPGIFSTLDSITKRSAHRSFNENNCPPAWLNLPEAKSVVEEDTFFKMPVEHNWVLVGKPDDIFKMADNSYHIIDYKTAKFTGRQDELLPMYEVQLNAYALMAEVYGFAPVKKLSLLYFQPQEDLDDDENFKLSFTTHYLPVDFQPQRVMDLLKQARLILSEPSPPEANENCRGICNWLEKYREYEVGSMNKE